MQRLKLKMLLYVNNLLHFYNKALNSLPYFEEDRGLYLSKFVTYSNCLLSWFSSVNSLNAPIIT